MKTITIGNANAAGSNLVGDFENVPQAIKRLAERDIKIVVVSAEFLEEYNAHEMGILKSTFSRYGARLERAE